MFQPKKSQNIQDCWTGRWKRRNQLTDVTMAADLVDWTGLDWTGLDWTTCCFVCDELTAADG
jgi:hypothetical protein